MHRFSIFSLKKVFFFFLFLLAVQSSNFHLSKKKNFKFTTSNSEMERKVEVYRNTVPGHGWVSQIASNRGNMEEAIWLLILQNSSNMIKFSLPFVMWRVSGNAFHEEIVNAQTIFMPLHSRWFQPIQLDDLSSHTINIQTKPETLFLNALSFFPPKVVVGISASTNYIENSQGCLIKNE